MYYDNKAKRKRVGKIVAQDGPATWVSSGAGLHKVSTRELQHYIMLRCKEKTDGATESSDAESIPKAPPQVEKEKAEEDQWRIRNPQSPRERGHEMAENTGRRKQDEPESRD